MVSRYRPAICVLRKSSQCPAGGIADERTALPTQIHPDDRTGYITCILDDLEDREGATWSKWPEDGTYACFDASPRTNSTPRDLI